jgi:adenylate cyclase
MTETSSFTILGIVGFGMGVSFLLADFRTPTSRALALLFGVFGANMILNSVVPPIEGDHPIGEIAFWSRVFSVVEALNFAVGYEWLLRIRRTEAAPGGSVLAREGLLRAAQAIAIFHGVLGLLLPEERYFLRREFDRGAFAQVFETPSFWYGALPIYVSLGLALVSAAQLIRSRPDSAEVVRLIATAIATPFLISGLFLPHRWMPVLTAIGFMIFLAGSIRYHVLQGERAQFVGRFVSPEVARLVRERGLERALQRTRLEISALVCDLRGFTRFSEVVPSEAVTRLLEDYYDAVGAAVSKAGGTIKDHSGDGVLALFGAPIPLPDHAVRAAEAARNIRDRTADVLRQRSPNGSELGIGIGIASGLVTVGAIGGATRLEYVAVGPAVNLASRLCDQAAPGEILVDERVATLASSAARFEVRGIVALPGFAEQRRIHAIR